MSRASVLLAAAAGLLAPITVLAPAHADTDRAYVEGKLTDAAGHPFGAVDVAIGTRKPGGTLHYHRFLDATTDPAGHYVIDLYKGKVHAGEMYYVLATRDHKVLASQRIKTLRVGHDVKAPTFAVPTTAVDAAWPGPSPTGAQPAIRGAVSAAAGNPIIDFTAGEVVSPGMIRATRSPWNQYAAYRDTPDQATYHLGIFAPGYEPYDAQVALSGTGTATQDAVLTAEPIVTGRVVVPEGHRGWNRADVNISNAAGDHVAKVGVDAQGHFRAVLDDSIGTRPYPGPYTITVKVIRLHPSVKLVARPTKRWTFAPGTTTHVGELTVHKP